MKKRTDFVPDLTPLYRGSATYRWAIWLRTLHTLITKGAVFLGLVLYLNQTHTGMISIGLLVTVYFLPQLFLASMTGSISDAFRDRRQFLAVSFIGTGLLYFLYPYAGWIVFILLIRFAQGIIESAIRPLTQAYASDEGQKEHRGDRVSLFKIMVFAGAAAGPLVAGVALDRIGFRDLFFASGLLMAGTGITAYLLLPDDLDPAPEPDDAPKPPRDPSSESRDRPEDALNQPLQFLKHHILKNPLINAWNDGPEPSPFSVRKVANNSASLFLLITFIRRLAFNMFTIFIPVFLSNHLELGSGAIGGFEGLRRTLIVIGILVSGAIADRKGRKPLLVFASFSFLGPLLYVGIPRISGVWMACAVLGITIGCFNPTSITYMSDHASRLRRGTYLGILESVSSLSRVIGPAIGGVIAWAAGVPWIFLTAGLLMSLTVPLSFFLEETLDHAGKPT